MASLVEELQHDATRTEVKVTDLLRRALLVGAKLNIAEFKEWTSKELSGYSAGSEMPEYRVLNGVPYDDRGYERVPVNIVDTGGEADLEKRLWFIKLLTQVRVLSPTSEIEELVEGSKKKGTTVIHWTSSASSDLLMGQLEGQFVIDLSLSSYVAILDTIRNIVLQWSIDLEHKGILGEGMSFTSREKDNAADHAFYITNYYNINSNQVSSTTINQGAMKNINNFNISNSHIGVINTGEVERIELAMQIMKDRNDLDLAGAFQEFAQAVLDAEDIPEPEKNELLEQVAEVSEQALKPPEKRKKGIIKSLLGGIKSLATTTTTIAEAWEKVEPIVKGFFDLPV